MGGKLLLADDSITIQKVVELVLVDEGFEIRTANNGEDALSTLQHFKPDVILADIEMPKINGYQLCEKIKANPSIRDIPVILLAGAFEPIDEELARNVGADDFIIKPFESQELISKINAVLTARQMEAEAVTFEGPAEEGTVETLEPVLEGEEWMTEELISEAATEETPLEVFEEAVTEEVGVYRDTSLQMEESHEGITTVPSTEEEALERPAIVPSVMELPSREEMLELFRTEIRDRIVPLMSEMKDSFISTMSPYIKDSAEKVLWEVVPDLVERLLKEMLQGTLASLTKEVEKVIWETVPDLAETLIKREIEKIRSET